MKHKKMLKKLFFSLALAAGLALCTAAVCSFADYYTYEYSVGPNGGVKLTSVDPKPEGAYEIPRELQDGRPVTALGDNLFAGSQGLTSVTIPASVVELSGWTFSNCQNLTSVTFEHGSDLTKIGEGTFNGCYNLANIETPGYTATFADSLTTIGDNAFCSCERLTSMKIPMGIQTIGNDAFAYCSSLTRVTFLTPSNLTTIGNNAFKGCSSLTSIEIPANVTTIGESAFELCAGLTSIEIPANVTTIGECVFDRCSNMTAINVSEGNRTYSSQDGVLYNKNKTTLLRYPEGKTDTSFTIPEGVTAIGLGRDLEPFRSCDKLKSVTIPLSMQTIGEWDFDGCKNLTDAFVPTETEIDNGAFYNTSVNVWRYDVLDDQTGAQEGKTLVRITSVAQVDGSASDAESVACGAMGDDYVIRSVGEDVGVTLTHSYNWPQDATFDYTKDGITWVCRILEGAGNTVGKVAIAPKEMWAIGGEVTIPSAVNNGCFDYTVTEIEMAAFSGCSGLTSVTIPESVTTIGGAAFRGCSSLTSVEIPLSVTTIGNTAFFECRRLTSVTIPEGVTTIGENAFCSCHNLASVTIPSSVITIGNGAFLDCTGLTSVTIQEGITTIGNTMFTACNNLQNITIPSSVTTIGERAFSGCSNFTNITIPHKVISIGSDALKGCTNLTDVYVKNGLDVSSANIKGDANVWKYVVLSDQTGAPEGKTLVKITSVARSNGDPSEAEFVTCGAMGENYLIRSVDEDVGVTLRHSCSYSVGDTFDYTKDEEIWECTILENGNVSIVPKDKTSVSGTEIIPSTVTNGCFDYTVTTIGNNAFNGCSSLTRVTIPSSVTTIGNSAFSGCSGLTSVTIPEGVTTIGDYAFNACSSLTAINVDANNYYYFSEDGILYNKDKTTLIKYPEGKIDTSFMIPSGVTTIGKSAFYNCGSLTNIEIPSSVTTIGMWAFRECSNLTSITIPSSVTTIGSSAFYKCSGLVSVTIPSSVTTIESNTFAYCSGLTSVTIPSSVTTIGMWAFRECSNLTSITIPSSVTTIGSEAFRDCSNLTSITIPSSVTKINNRAFYGCRNLTDAFIEENDQGNIVDISDARIQNSADVWHYKVLPDQTGAPEGKTLVKITSVAKADGSASSATSVACGAMGENYVIRSVEVSGVTLTHSCNSLNGIFDYTDSNNITWTCTISEAAVGNTPGSVSIALKDKSLISGAVEIPSTVTNGCFDYTVTKINYWAFSGCSGLTNVTIPSSVTTIGTYAFTNCSSLTSVEIPSSVTTIGSRAFSGCSGLTSVEIPSSVTTIGNGAFFGCSGLTSVTIQEGVTTIDEIAFNGCSGLTKVTIPSSVTTIGERAFRSCSQLTDAFVPSGATVDNKAFNRTSVNIWRYEVLPEAEQTVPGKTLVKIVSVAKADESVNPVESVSCNAMGENYVIDTAEIDIDNFKLTHDLQHEDRQEPTTTEEGHIEGYTCSYCGKHFRDEEGTDEIPDDEWIIYSSGDVNGDGFDNILDLQMLYNHVAGVSILTEEQLRRADLNNNGTVDIIDLQMLFNIIAAA